VDDTDTVNLAKLAGNISNAAGEAVNMTQDVYNASKDPALETIHRDCSCFAEACTFLSRELSEFDVTTSDWDQ
jgi:hypothetical protein